MASDKQIAANRRNARKSTGPKSTAGRDRASRNALKHGLASRQLILPGESTGAFEALRAGLMAEFAPQGALETELAEEIAVHLWRLRRVPDAEAGILAHAQVRNEREAARAELRAIEAQLYEGPMSRLAGAAGLAGGCQANQALGGAGSLTPLRSEARGLSAEARAELKGAEAAASARLAAADARLRTDANSLGRAFATDAARHATLTKLARYAGTIERSLSRTLRELERLQHRRRRAGEGGRDTGQRGGQTHDRRLSMSRGKVWNRPGRATIGSERRALTPMI